MKMNNYQRLGLWLQLTDKFDYDEFCNLCDENKYPRMNPLEFAQKSGIVTVAVKTYPAMPAADAYNTFTMNTAPQESVKTNAPTAQQYTTEKIKITYEDGTTEEREVQLVKGGCCGGGTVK